MKTTSILLATATTLLAACGSAPGTGSASSGERVVLSADAQKTSVQYFEVAHPSSVEEVLTAYDAKDAAVFSIDYLSCAAHTQRTITLASARISRTRTVAETPVSATGDGTIRPQMTKECAQAYFELAVAFDFEDWEAFDFYADSIIAFGC